MQDLIIDIDEKPIRIRNDELFCTKGGFRSGLVYGIAGDVTFDYLPEELLLLFVAGEKIHIGKNTSFGFGKYVVQ